MTLKEQYLEQIEFGPRPRKNNLQLSFFIRHWVNTPNGEKSIKLNIP